MYRQDLERIRRHLQLKRDHLRRSYLNFQNKSKDPNSKLVVVINSLQEVKILLEVYILVDRDLLQVEIGN